MKSTEKRGPGRPKTGTAMTAAEKQKKYRERKSEKTLSLEEIAIVAVWGESLREKNRTWCKEDEAIIQKIRKIIGVSKS